MDVMNQRQSGILPEAFLNAYDAVAGLSEPMSMASLPGTIALLIIAS